MNRDDPSMMRLSATHGMEEWLDTSTGLIHSLPPDTSEPGPVMLAFESAMVEIDIPYRLVSARVAEGTLQVESLLCPIRITVSEESPQVEIRLTLPLMVPLDQCDSVWYTLERMTEGHYMPFEVDHETGGVSFWVGVDLSRGSSMALSIEILDRVGALCERYQGVVINAVVKRMKRDVAPPGAS